MIERSERARDVTGCHGNARQRRNPTAAALTRPITVEAAGPPVHGGVVDDRGQHGVFVCEQGGKGPRFVSVRNRENHVLLAAVVVVVIDLVPVVLERIR